MVLPSTSATLVAGSSPPVDFAALVPPPVLQATNVAAQRTKACKRLLFMPLSGTRRTADPKRPRPSRQPGTTLAFQNPSPDEIKALLQRVKTVAVVGLSL